MGVRDRLLAALFAAVVVLCAVGVLAYRSMSRLVDANEAVDRTERLLLQVEETYSAIADAETGSRGYVLTGNPAHLRAYRMSIDSLPLRLTSLRRLAADDSRRRAHVVRLEGLIVRRLDAIRTTIHLRETAGVQAAVVHIRAGRGAAIMDTIRAVVDRMEREEGALRQRGVVRARAGVRYVTAAMSIGFAIALSISLLAAVSVHRELRARTSSEERLRVAKEDAESANRAKSDFLARMSHELRTPLNSVIGFSNVMLKRHGASGGDARSRVYLERIRDNGMHLLHMIDDLLDIARIEVGRVKIERQPVALDELVRDVAGSFEEDARRRELTLDVEIPDGLAPINTDRMRLRQVLVNLVGNALKFTERGGVTVQVAADPATGAPCSIAVADTGIGIAPERQQAVFDAFEQADTSTVRRYGGTGLGLAISKALCGLLGYRLELVSEVGRGSTFTIRMGK